ncbi:hypothetical protein M427DRAFT_59890 [Gonapodya prolifera JEL478]|uniref:Cation efflux protein transmembrane domain-containing protein n=1 Tax=Gonapodya prolifera (strain JEL478) TaxID=1344416 RepID=A0A139A6F6_GONPJ|nr:hypothetical protein M427DRAFT_59890 [Gonapodya prolifera JEL478]|eukprot:KXS12025.1 hypothetical protein M427DRAFT_59890 [Gonapodya prolifera JEL478]
MASAIDSVLDLVSGSVIFFTTRAASSRKDIAIYPTGKSRLEPLGIMVLAILSSMAAVQVINESIRRFISSEPVAINMAPLDIALLCIVVATKFALWLYCRQVVESPGCQALAQDHFNDVISNTFTTIAGVLAARTLWWIDPFAACLISLYIIGNWLRTTMFNIKRLTGPVASPRENRLLTHLVYSFLAAFPSSSLSTHVKDYEHFRRELENWLIDTVRPYHLGNNLFVEVDIVLPPQLPLLVAHDIGQALQDCLEAFPQFLDGQSFDVQEAINLSRIERAFVHLDWEWRHVIEHQGLVRQSSTKVKHERPSSKEATVAEMV